MTTITYKNDIMAADSGLYDDDGHYYGSVEKIFRLKDGSLLGCSGDGDQRLLIALLNATGSDISKSQLIEAGASGHLLLAEPDGSVYYIDIWIADTPNGVSDAAVNKVEHTHYAVGAGGKVASGLMAAGLTAEQAIQAVMGENVFNRAPIQVKKLYEADE